MPLNRNGVHVREFPDLAAVIRVLLNDFTMPASCIKGCPRERFNARHLLMRLKALETGCA